MLIPMDICLQEEQSELLAQVVWLLQHDFIHELNTVRKGTSVPFVQRCFISGPDFSGVHVRQYVHYILPPDDPAASMLSPTLRKLLHNGQLDGTKHVIEILWSEPSLDKAELSRELQDPQSPFLVTTVRPSPCPYDC
jgi:hypothetical protein